MVTYFNFMLKRDFVFLHETIFHKHWAVMFTTINSNKTTPHSLFIGLPRMYDAMESAQNFIVMEFFQFFKTKLWRNGIFIKKLQITNKNIQ